MPATAFAHIGQIASQRLVHEAFQWLHLHEQQIMRWQVELVTIPAPPFAEQVRAEWLLDRFMELGLANPHLDAAGNVLATLPGRRGRSAPGLGGNSGVSAGTQSGAGPLVVLSAHIDTVFPPHTPINPILAGSRLTAPGACDNGAGVAALLALAASLVHTGFEPGCAILFAGNVGEEGEGDLRGMRHLYQHAGWRERVVAHLVLDGAGHQVAVTQALGSRRFEAVIEGSGGHSWTDATRPNPIAALCDAVTAMAVAGRPEPLAAGNRLEDRRGAELVVEGETGCGASPASGRARPSQAAPARSTWNVGAIEGGGAVNAIPEQARARFDLRSTDPEQLLLLEVALYRAIEDAVLAANAAAAALGDRAHPLRFALAKIGDRPAGGLREGARILELLRSVDRHLNLRTECRTASTDANLPLSLGIEAVSIGAGGDGGGIHTRGEWYDAYARDLGLRRVLLLLLALASEREQVTAAAD